MPRPSKIAAVRLKFARRMKKILGLRLKGYTCEEIAAEVGDITPARIHQILTGELAKWNSERREMAAELTALELLRLDDLYRRAHDKLEQTGGDWKYNEQCLRIMERRARLVGLDAPIKTELKVGNLDEATDEELIAEAKRLGLPIPQLSNARDEEEMPLLPGMSDILEAEFTTPHEGSSDVPPLASPESGSPDEQASL